MLLLRFSVIFIFVFNFLTAQRPQQQWYLTGKNFNDQRNSSKYQSEIINMWSISAQHGVDEKAINFTHSSFGGAIAVFIGHNRTLDDGLKKLIQEVLRPHFHTNYEFQVADIWHYDIFVSVNQENILQYEIGLYDLARAQWLKYGIHQVKLGKEWRIVCNISYTNDENESCVEVHRFVVTSDLYHTLTMTQHTWEILETKSPELPVHTLLEPESLNLRVMTYNIWHNNPPSWLLHDNNKRWKWYQKRMRHLAKMIHIQNPDIIALQEVRLDNGFPPKTTSIQQLLQHGYEFHFKDDPEKIREAIFSDPTGSQLHHMLRYLHQSYLSQLEESPQSNPTEECILLPDSMTVCSSNSPSTENVAGSIFKKIFDRYQFVYQPAMSMYERENMGKRVEEGLAILVKNNFKSSRDSTVTSHSLHVSKIQTLFLPRNFEDPSDDHHRAVLHLELELRLLNSSSDALPITIDVMTTHMSLSSTAREESVKAIWNYTKSDCHGDIQILTGDFNAEPHENAYGCLTGRCYTENWKNSFQEDDCPCNTHHDGPYIDSWLHSQRELRGYHANGIIEDGMNKYTEIEQEGYTYPPCKPEKRIDFILIRNQTKHHHKKTLWKGQILSSWLVGKEVTPETAHLLSSTREGLGMLDKDSPIWASDHYAVVSDIQLDKTVDV